MTSFRPVLFPVVLAFTLFSASGVSAQNSAIDCQAQNSSPGCTAAQTQPASRVTKVTYLNGQLTISARNAHLGDVLRAVSTQTGAVIEFPADRAGEPMFAQEGPGPVRDVLAKLLSGFRFNYVMLGSPSNPNVLQRMILTNSDQPAGTLAAEAASPSAPPVVPVTAESENSESDVPVIPPQVVQVTSPEQIEPPKTPLTPEALKQMVQERMAARRQQQEQESTNPPQ